METPTISFTICYNVVPNAQLSVPLPNAYLVATENDVLGYIEKLAIPQVLDSYDVTYKNTAHEELLEICQLLKPEVLAQKFQPKRKKVFTLADLTKDPKLKPLVVKYVDQKLTEFYEILSRERYPLCYNAQRREPISYSLVAHEEETLKPLVSFQKTTEGIEYQLQLGVKDTILTPSEHEITPLHDKPAQLLIDRKWYGLEHLNAKKLKPFLNKETVFIPAKNTKLYFEKFISSMLKKVEVQAEGFSIEIENEISGYSLEMYYDFFLKKVACHIQFDYQDTVFSSYETRKTATEVSYENEDISLKQTKRAPEVESEISEKLAELGLTQESGKFFLPEDDNKDPYALVEWFAKNAPVLQQKGFDITSTLQDEKKKSHL